MATGVGLTIGASESVAAVVTTERESDPILVQRDSILHMSADGAAVLGDVAPVGYAHSIVDFLAFVGSPAGIVVDDSEPYRAEDLVATALFCLLNLAAEHLVGPAEFYATHPPDWPAEHIALLREALDYLGLRSVMLTPAESDTPKDAALAAATQAHAAVLATPAGTTPPDDAPAENAGVDTAVLPAIEQPAEAKAYSATPATAAEPVLLLSTMEAPLAAGPLTADPPPRKHTLALVGAAAVVLLALGGVSLGIALHGKTADDSNSGDATAPTSSVAHGIPAPIATSHRPAPSFAPAAPHPPARKPVSAPAPLPPPPAAPQAPFEVPAQPPGAAPTAPSTEPYSPYYVPPIPGMTDSDVPSYPTPGSGQPYGGVQPFFHYTPPQ